MHHTNAASTTPCKQFPCTRGIALDVHFIDRWNHLIDSYDKLFVVEGLKKASRD